MHHSRFSSLKPDKQAVLLDRAAINASSLLLSIASFMFLTAIRTEKKKFKKEPSSSAVKAIHSWSNNSRNVVAADWQFSVFSNRKEVGL